MTILLSIPQAAARLGISQGRVRQLVYAQKLPAQRYGRDWLIRKDDLEAFAGQARKPGRTAHQDATEAP